MCSLGKKRDLQDIESLYLEQTDLNKEENFIPKGKEDIVHQYTKELCEDVYEDEISYRWKKIDYSDIYLYVEVIYILFSCYVVGWTIWNIVWMINFVFHNFKEVMLFGMIGILWIKKLWDIIYFMDKSFVDRFERKKIVVLGRKKFEDKNLYLRRKYSFLPSKRQILYVYRMMRCKNEIEENESLEKYLMVKSMRSESGVMVVSVIMPPDTFSCSYDCHYCPNDPRYSRSYYHGEPTVMRGARNGFSAYKQFKERVICYLMNGHPVDKCEVIVLGGTFSCYQPKVAENFLCELYYCANTIFDKGDEIRPMKTIEEEIEENESSMCKIIGLTIETRPDKITKYELRRFRRYGVTRIQMGLQHTDDEILRKINRECTQREIKNAIKLAKDECFKVDIHIMPDLPFSNLEKDKEMFDILLKDTEYCADQWKIYPTNVLEFTKIKEWYDSGEYKPYAESDFEGFMNLLCDVMKRIPPYIRVNRVQRDFPGNYIVGGNSFTHLRQMMDERMKNLEMHTKDIRSMEIKDGKVDRERIHLVRYDYESSGGKEIFLSMKSCTCKICVPYEIHKLKRMFMLNRVSYYGCGNENKIHGFLRLRITDDSGWVFPELKDKALIRELHVYGRVSTTYDSRKKSQNQHKGMGGELLKMAERIVREETNKSGMAVISGVGVRNYYRRFGYEMENERESKGGFMVKRF